MESMQKRMKDNNECRNVITQRKKRTNMLNVVAFKFECQICNMHVIRDACCKVQRIKNSHTNAFKNWNWDRFFVFKIYAVFKCSSHAKQIPKMCIWLLYCGQIFLNHGCYNISVCGEQWDIWACQSSFWEHFLFRRNYNCKQLVTFQTAFYYSYQLNLIPLPGGNFCSESPKKQSEIGVFC